jgi:LysM repeat protein
MRSARPNAAASALFYPFGRETAIRPGAVRVRPALITSRAVRFLRSSVPRLPWFLGIVLLAFPGVRLTASLFEPPPVAIAPLPLHGPQLTSAPAITVAAPLPESYVLEEGDNLFDLAVDLESSVEALMLANNLDDLNLLEVGAELVVPPPGSTRQPTDPTLTLAQVAATYGLDPEVLRQYNWIPPDLVHTPIGREILLFPPGVRPLGLPPETEFLENGLFGSIPFGAERPAEPFIYRVRPGDMLLDVAWRLGIDLDTIVNNNGNLVDADRIRIGDELLVLPISGLLYEVEEGDSLPAIAEKFSLEVGPILEFNSFELDDEIEVGKTLILPGAGPRYAPAPPPGLAAPGIGPQPGFGPLVVPYRSQLDGTPWAGANCGPVSLAMGLGAFGINVSSTELRRQVLNAQGMWGNNIGTLMNALARVAQSYGVRPVGLSSGNGIARWSLDDLRDQLRAGHPVIVQVRFRALPGRARVAYYGDHYIILTGLSGENFLYNDPLPSDGPGANRIMTPGQLHTAMNASDRRFAYAAFALTR